VPILERRDDAAGRERHRVLVERLASLVFGAGGAQRERGTECSAEVVSLGQLPGVDGQQRARSGQERELELT
jgi:hypothetical protein